MSLVVTIGCCGGSGGGISRSVDLLQVVDIHDVRRWQAGSVPGASGKGHVQLNKRVRQSVKLARAASLIEMAQGLVALKKAVG